MRPPRGPARRPVDLALVAALTATLTATAVGGLAPAAQADRVVHDDARHDVRQTREGRPGSVATPRRREPDITRVRISYTDERLRLRVRLRALSADRNQAALTQIKTPDYTAGVYVTRLPSRDLLSVSLIRGFGTVVPCPGLHYRSRFARGVVSVVVPRACLDDAPWVRAGFALSWTTARRALTDDALSPRLSGVAGLTRRLYAG